MMVDGGIQTWHRTSKGPAGAKSPDGGVALAAVRLVAIALLAELR